MRVKGSLASVQSSLDFYLKISSLNGIKSVEELRRYYFNIFLNEERNQASLLLKEKLELEKRKQEEKVENENLENGMEDLEEGNADDLFSNSFFVQNNPVQEPVQEEVADDIEYAEHGVYLDEIEDVEENVVEEVEDIQVITPAEGYVEHGVFLDEIVEEEEEEETFEDSEEEDLWDSEAEEDETFEKSEEFIEEDEEVFEESESEEFIEEEVDLVDEEIEQKQEQEQVHLEVSKVEEPMSIPSDIRVFLKQHPNSDISYVAQFYSKKEIDKQIKLGRIYKKRGKLLI